MFSVLGTGELIILHSPKSLKFTGHELLRESLVKEVYSAALGFSIEHVIVLSNFVLCKKTTFSFWFAFSGTRLVRINHQWSFRITRSRGRNFRRRHIIHRLKGNIYFIIFHNPRLYTIYFQGHLKGHKYPLITDYNEFNTWESLHHRITQRFPESGNKLVNINLSDGVGAVSDIISITLFKCV